jgi:hypothetical protein
MSNNCLTIIAASHPNVQLPCTERKCYRVQLRHETSRSSENSLIEENLACYPVSTLALQLLTPDEYHMIGWAIRYLVNDLLRAIVESPTQVCVRVVKVNPAPTPAKQRVLIELTGHWPENYEPMSMPEFQLLVH